MTRLDAQSRAVTRRALLFVDELGELFFDRHRVSLMVAALQIVHHAFKRMLADDGATAFVDVSERNFFFPRAVQYDLLRIFAQVFEWRIDIEFIVL